MSLWSSASTRVTMINVNNNRFVSNKRHVPPRMPGPAEYNPKKPEKNHGVFVDMKTSPVSRDQVLSNGERVQHILPLGPGEYDPYPEISRLPSSPREHKGWEKTDPVEKRKQLKRPFGNATPRSLNMINVNANTLHDYEIEEKFRPGPGYYDAKTSANGKPFQTGDVPTFNAGGSGGWMNSSWGSSVGGSLGGSSAGSPPLSARGGHRHHTGGTPGHSPGEKALVMPPSPPKANTARSGGRQHQQQSYKGSPRLHHMLSPTNCGGAGGSPSSQRLSTAPPGVEVGSSGVKMSFSRTPRRINFHNLNNPMEHDHDPDYDNPGPGTYADSTGAVGGDASDTIKQRSTQGVISMAKRKLTPVRNRWVPGPGTYDPGAREVV